jgi:hypothetical protein
MAKKEDVGLWEVVVEERWTQVYAVDATSAADARRRLRGQLRDGSAVKQSCPNEQFHVFQGIVKVGRAWPALRRVLSLYRKDRELHGAKVRRSQGS